MTPARILLALALVAAAVLVACGNKPPSPGPTGASIVVERSDSDKGEKMRVIRVVPSIPRPRNGQCPVCGTMAKPYHMSKTEEQLGMKNSRRVDCEHCNTTFRQWAEGKEPKQ